MSKARDLANVGSVAAQGLTSRNKIINGAMVIDQRNAGASVTPTTLYNTFATDRWNTIYNTGSKFSFQQVSTAPTGFVNSLKITSAGAYSVLANDTYYVTQSIEGYNVADLGWGTANAKTVTLSFWVQSSLTGSFGGSLNNGDTNRSYPFSYTISAANTWEQKTITIAGDTTGTWATTNTAGLVLRLALAVGSTYSGTAGAWAAGVYYSTTGSTNILGTSGATWLITGVQLEVGSTATSFDYRPYTTELQLCQRYYQTYPGIGNGNRAIWTSYGAVANYAYWIFKTSMRTSPTIAGATLGTVDPSSPEAVGVYSTGSAYGTFGYNGSSYGQATATAEL